MLAGTVDQYAVVQMLSLGFRLPAAVMTSLLFFFFFNAVCLAYLVASDFFKIIFKIFLITKLGQELSQS